MTVWVVVVAYGPYAEDGEAVIGVYSTEADAEKAADYYRGWVRGSFELDAPLVPTVVEP